MSAFGMLLQGKVIDALIRVIETITGLKVPVPVASLMHRLGDDEGQIIYAAAEKAWAELKQKTPIPQIASDIWATIKDQVPSKAISDLEDALGLVSRA